MDSTTPDLVQSDLNGHAKAQPRPRAAGRQAMAAGVFHAAFCGITCLVSGRKT
jgi:hypothetical protein